MRRNMMEMIAMMKSILAYRPNGLVTWDFLFVTVVNFHSVVLSSYKSYTVLCYDSWLFHHCVLVCRVRGYIMMVLTVKLNRPEFIYLPQLEPHHSFNLSVTQHFLSTYFEIEINSTYSLAQQKNNNFPENLSFPSRLCEKSHITNYYCSYISF